jgi:multicomponent Na+:H+ antiporter subunit D
MTKVWAGAFWGDRPATATDAAGTDAPPAIGVLTAGATGVVVALSIAYVVFAGPIYDFSQRAAEQLLDPVGYVRAVLGGAS